MRKWIFLWAIYFSHFAFAEPLKDHQLNPVALCELAAALNIPANANLIEETQKHWLRKPGQERWEMLELPQKQKQFVISWAEKEGLYAPWAPSNSLYDKALILGTTVPLMQKRLDYLKKLWNDGIQFHEIVWLTGERPLDPQMDGLSDHYQNEAEAARYLWKSATLPEQMQQLPVVFISLPMQGTKRPNTEDTINAWLKTETEPVKSLFISDQPFNGYQFAVVKTNLPDAFTFDLVGPGVDPQCHPAAAAITLDTIARWIYQEALYQKSNH